MDFFTSLIEYEEGALDDAGTLELFAELIRTGLAWSLQGSYGRTASHLIGQGFITAEGKVV